METKHAIDEQIEAEEEEAEVEPVEIEFCSNDEWLGAYGPYDESDQSEAACITPAARKLYASQIAAVEDIPGVVVVRAKGRRSLCHGWNGAQFRRRFGRRAFGTFEKIDDELAAKIEEAIDSKARGETVTA